MKVTWPFPHIVEVVLIKTRTLTSPSTSYNLCLYLCLLFLPPSLKLFLFKCSYHREDANPYFRRQLPGIVRLVKASCPLNLILNRSAGELPPCNNSANSIYLTTIPYPTSLKPNNFKGWPSSYTFIWLGGLLID